ncbi:hypothetical protein DSO57_1035808 [Entomophthora muscae]|uniref:Uncharacterized protein n=1 Tax=Entomophthora muscae TaxID=34485 RepID=A0ACC2U981_9FUNG|nr:hypothetical protein DSO57_1035808 [Entomophthora muscae]
MGQHISYFGIQIQGLKTNVNARTLLPAKCNASKDVQTFVDEKQPDASAILTPGFMVYIVEIFNEVALDSQIFDKDAVN